MKQIAGRDKGGHSFAGQLFWDCGGRTAPRYLPPIVPENGPIFWLRRRTQRSQ
ncbi:hypothetical protein ACNJX9_19845 [Bradyrhizobium sp. DASA03076]|uniref:hypothetical protein n=1 Tax=Bradyrhizobium TaxID=374 RepID=UPI000A6541E3|nr:hypothetical protein [Bradyrhizobium manausense]